MGPVTLATPPWAVPVSAPDGVPTVAVAALVVVVPVPSVSAEVATISSCAPMSADVIT